MTTASFLIAAHNEEKHIGKVLENLKNLKKDFPEIEVIVGNDGSTDKTSEIVDRYKFVRHIHLNERKGKNTVINRIIKKANGEVIIIHDADWLFKVNDKKDFQKMLSWFDDKKIGGVAESFPIEYETENQQNTIAYLGNMWGTYLWIEFLKEKYTYKENELRLADPSQKGFPFLVNIFRKELYKDNTTLGDDFERTLDILSNGYKVIVLDEPKMPRMHTLTPYIKYNDIVKQKKRTERARSQVFRKYNINIGLLNFYLPLFIYYMKNIGKTKTPKGAFSLLIWIAMFIYASLISKIKNRNLTTEKGWLMRARR